jgi:7-carboxy-7-deazaguanine synthase
MKIVEVFGAVQGEGINTGKPTIFIRFAGCNLKCKWCDTPYHRVEGNEASVEDLIELIGYSLTDNITFTGGEPLIQNKQEFIELVKGIHKLGKKVFVETNGVIFDNDIYKVVDFFSISPKLPSSGNTLGNYMFGVSQYVDKNKGEFSSHIQLKYVVSTKEDLDRMKTDLRRLEVDRKVPVILQPCTDYKETAKSYVKKAKKLCEGVVDDPDMYKWNWRFLLQQHVVLYGKRRGV